MRKKLVVCFLTLSSFISFSQENIENINEINLDKIAPNQVHRYWLNLIDNGFSQPISIPVIIAKGKYPGPVLGLLAAIHGNELNGIKVIQDIFKDINTNELSGTVIAVPGLNHISITQDKRRFIDEEDLNRNFPGKEKGNRSQQYTWQINQKILPKLDYLIDMHTASFGRVNSLYVRADMSNDKMKQMALLQDADIILNNQGAPSAGNSISTNRTMRAEAISKGIPAITVEYGNPQVFQPKMISRGVIGVKNVMNWLKMHPFEKIEKNNAILCKKSYWIYIDRGGFLEVPVELNQIIDKGTVIGILKNPFGEIIETYKCPEKGVVIGKSSNPININGGRIIHLGILEK